MRVHWNTNFAHIQGYIIYSPNLLICLTSWNNQVVHMKGVIAINFLPSLFLLINFSYIRASGRWVFFLWKRPLTLIGELLKMCFFLSMIHVRPMCVHLEPIQSLNVNLHRPYMLTLGEPNLQSPYYRTFVQSPYWNFPISNIYLLL